MAAFGFLFFSTLQFFGYFTIMPVPERA